MNEMHDIYQQAPSYGYRRMTIALRARGFHVNHKKVLALQRQSGIQAIYPGKRTSTKNPEHKVFPYLLRDLSIERPNQVWQTDITYIKIKGGFVFLVALIDVFSRKIMAWHLSISLDTQACLTALEQALQHNLPEIINSDQGCQFTSDAWVTYLQQKAIAISMDGKGRWADNVHIERLWRTIKYEMVYLHSFDTVAQLRHALAAYIQFYNTVRHHSQLNYHTPDAVFLQKRIPTKEELLASFVPPQPQAQDGAAMC